MQKFSELKTERSPHLHNELKFILKGKVLYILLKNENSKKSEN